MTEGIERIVNGLLDEQISFAFLCVILATLRLCVSFLLFLQRFDPLDTKVLASEA